MLAIELLQGQQQHSLHTSQHLRVPPAHTVSIAISISFPAIESELSRRRFSLSPILSKHWPLPLMTIEGVLSPFRPLTKVQNGHWTTARFSDRAKTFQLFQALITILLS